MEQPRSSRQPKADASAEAIDVALHIFRQPSQSQKLRSSRLPIAILDILKAAAGDESTLAELAEKRRTTPEYIKEASQFYLRLVLTSDLNDNHRKLALDPDASTADIRDHKRWLLKWLHPDRNPNLWEAKLFKLVRDAAEKLDGIDPLLPPPSKPEPKRASKKTSSNQVWRHANTKRRKLDLLSILKSGLKKFAILAVFLAIAFVGFNKLMTNEAALEQIEKLLDWKL